MKTQKIVIALSMFLTLATIPSCIINNFGFSGEGSVVSETLELDNIQGIKLNGSFDVVLRQGPVQVIKAEGHQNIIDRLELDVHNGTWDIELLPGQYHNYQLTIYVTVPELNLVQLNGSGDIDIHSFEDLNTIDVKINGSGEIHEKGPLYVIGNAKASINGSGDAHLKITCLAFEYQQTGSGNMHVSGQCVDQEITMSGSGDYTAFDFHSENCKVRLNGSGDAKVSASRRLDARVFGSGDISYKGLPTINFSRSGSGNLHNAN